MKKTILPFAGAAALLLTGAALGDALHVRDLPATKINKISVRAEKVPGVEFRVEHLGSSPYPLGGRNFPWSPNLALPNDTLDDELTSMAVDANGDEYVCFEIVRNAAGQHGWGISKSTDDGLNWDIRVYYANNDSLEVRWPEIAIDTIGKIWVWGTMIDIRQSPTFNYDVVFSKSEGALNDPDSLQGFYWLGMGNGVYRTYGEVVTYGDSTQLILSTWTFDHPDSAEAVVSYVYATDGGSGGWTVSTPDADGSSDGKTTIGVNYDGVNYVALHGWEQWDTVSNSWNVVCMHDTLETGSDLHGWETSTARDDRYPSVFASNGYAYIAFQSDVGGGNEDILFNYSTDYGVNWQGSSIGIADALENENYPRLYGEGQIIGCDYVCVVPMVGNQVRFTYSGQNGQLGTWRSTEFVTDNSSPTAYNAYRSPSLLWTSAYWVAAWSDTRTQSTQGLDIYTARRAAGEPDISTNPVELVYDYSAKGFEGGYLGKYLERFSRPLIDPRLREEMGFASPGELIPIMIDLAKQVEPAWLRARAAGLSKEEKRRFVTRELRALAAETQGELLSLLRQLETEGRAERVSPLWVTNSVGARVAPEVVGEVARLEGIGCIWLDEPVQHLGGFGHEPSEMGRAVSWNVARIKADSVWTQGYAGSGVVVGVLDSGCNYNHVDLADHMWNGTPYGFPNHGWDFVNDDDDPMDDDGHGTAAAGVVAGDGTAGTSTGVAPDAQIMALKCSPGGTAEMGEAIQFALTYGADILSCSIGWADPTEATKNWSRNQASIVHAADIVWCCSAGNGDEVGGHYPVPQDINAPACVPAPWYAPNGGNNAVMAVGVTDFSDNWSTWASYGPTEWDNPTYGDYPYPPGLQKPDVAAPGDDGITTLMWDNNTGYDFTFGGSSASCPHLAGTIALLLSKQPGIPPAHLDSIIESTCLDVSPAGRDNFTGAGRIDALQAFNSLSAGVKWATMWVKNSPSATGLLQIDNISRQLGSNWIVSVSPRSFSVEIGDSEAVIVTVDTTGMGLLSGQTYYDTLLLWSNDPEENPYGEPVSLMMPPLTVDLAWFTASAGRGWVTVSWKTASEQNSMEWWVMRSLSRGGGYGRIATIPAQGTSPYPTDYTYTDREVQGGVTYYYKVGEVDLSGTVTYHGPVFATPSSIGSGLMIFPICPNPFSHTALIRYNVSADGRPRTAVNLSVYDLSGRLVRVLVDEPLPTTYSLLPTSVEWDGRDGSGREVTSGIYFCRIQAGDLSAERKVVLIR